MKTSTKILWIAIITLCILLVIFSVMLQLNTRPLSFVVNDESIAPTNIGTHTQQYATESFDTIHARGSYHILVKQANKTSVAINADRDVIPYIKIYTKDHTLVIKTIDSQDGFLTHPTSINITTPTLKAIDLAGSTTLKTINLNGGDLLANTAGSTKLVLQGKIDNFYLRTAGSSSVNTQDLYAKNVDIKFAGSNHLVIRAINSIRVTGAGFGSLKILGNPPIVEKHMAGLLSIEN